MLSNVSALKRNAIAAVAALSMVAGAAAPAHALGKNERKFLQGAAAAALVGVLIHENQKSGGGLFNRNPTPAPLPAPVYQRPAPVYQQPVYQQPIQPQPVYGRVVGNGGYTSSIYNTGAAQAFNAYSLTERRAIQRKLAAHGYYYGGIDGSFGPGTYNAITAYARDTGAGDRLVSRNTAFAVYDGLIF